MTTTSIIKYVSLEILNCGKHASKDQIAETFQRLGSEAIKITKDQSQPWCRVILRNAEERARVMSKIADVAPVTDASEGPWRVKKVHSKAPRFTRSKVEEMESKSAADAVAPWRHLPYAEQLRSKQQDVWQSIEKWCLNRLEIPRESFEFKDILPSPVTMEYRNKLDFTVGLDAQGQACVGFRVGKFKDGGKSAFRVEVSDECLHTTPQVALDLADHLGRFIRAQSMDVYNQDLHIGFWRGMTVRLSSVTKQCMVVLRCNPDPTKEADVRQALAKQCVEHMKQFQSSDGQVRVTSMYWQWADEVSLPQLEESELEHCFGEEQLEEHILGSKFKVSPGAFFQVNTAGAEELFRQVQRLLQGDSSIEESASNTLLLDVCCGAGVIGLICHDVCKQMIGIELSKPAIADARSNVQLNNLHDSGKCYFICAKAETVMSRLLTGEAKPLLKKTDTKLTETDEAELVRALEATAQSKQIVAIVDPPRAGLHPSVVKALLRCQAVERIIYVSCNPTGSFVENAMDLCDETRPIKSKEKDVRAQEGIRSFRPTKFIPVDMFPHTQHCEMVAEFIRVHPQDKVEKKLKLG